MPKGSDHIGGVGVTIPFGSLKEGYLQNTSSSISFDPLDLIAVLPNPRASASAARLYGQISLDVFKWPHTSTYIFSHQDCLSSIRGLR